MKEGNQKRKQSKNWVELIAGTASLKSGNEWLKVKRKQQEEIQMTMSFSLVVKLDILVFYLSPT